MDQGGMEWTAPSTATVGPGVWAVTSPVRVGMEARVTPWMAAVPALQAGEERSVTSTARLDEWMLSDLCKEKHTSFIQRIWPLSSH